MTLKSFESALYRIRKQRGQGTPGTQTAPAPTSLSYDEKKGETAAAAPAAGKKAGDFEIPVPKRFTHNPKPDDDLLK